MKTKQQHTPGPDSPMVGARECECGQTPRWNGAQHCPKCAEAWDDARTLFAAAPELLAACESALEAVESHNLDGQSLGNIAWVLRAAIAKAEGR